MCCGMKGWAQRTRSKCVMKANGMRSEIRIRPIWRKENSENRSEIDDIILEWSGGKMAGERSWRRSKNAQKLGVLGVSNSHLGVKQKLRVKGVNIMTRSAMERCSESRSAPGCCEQARCQLLQARLCVTCQSICLRWCFFLRFGVRHHRYIV